MTAPTDLEAVFQVPKPYFPRVPRVGPEATNCATWQHRELEVCGVAVVLLGDFDARRDLPRSDCGCRGLMNES